MWDTTVPPSYHDTLSSWILITRHTSKLFWLYLREITQYTVQFHCISTNIIAWWAFQIWYSVAKRDHLSRYSFTVFHLSGTKYQFTVPLIQYRAPEERTIQQRPLELLDSITTHLYLNARGHVDNSLISYTVNMFLRRLWYVKPAVCCNYIKPAV